MLMMLPPLRHQRNGVIAAIVGAGQIRGDRRVPHAGVELGDVLRVVVADVVDQQVHPALVPGNLLEDGRHLAVHTHVHGQRPRAPPDLGDFLFERPRLGLGFAIQNHDVVAAGRQTFAEVPAQPPRTAGDDGDRTGPR